MEPFLTVRGPAAPMPTGNIDTDVIMPKQFLKGVDRSGLAQGAFFDLRTLSDGSPNPDFILNRPAWRESVFLVVGPNFGCGSSREHAVWGLRQMGVRALLGTSFAGIFFDNCARNGLLALTLPPDLHARLLEAAQDPRRNLFELDLPAQTVAIRGEAPSGFEIAADLKSALVRGLDQIGTTLELAPEIRDFEVRHFRAHPWLVPQRRTLG